MKKSKMDGLSVLWGALFYGVIGSLAVMTVYTQDPEFSVRERRRLTDFPRVSWSSLKSGRFAEQFEKFGQDHIYDRDELLDLKSWSSLHLFGALDDNGLVRHDGKLVQLETAIDEDSLNHAAALFDRMDLLLQDTACKVYVSIIPDKSYFLQDENALVMDYAEFFEKAEQVLPEGERIDLRDTLTFDDFYNTDPHWRQEVLLKTADRIASAMGVQIGDDFTTVDALEHFQGSLHGRTTMAVEDDHLRYLWNEQMKDWTLTVYDDGRAVTKPMYDETRLDFVDPYTFFVQGNPGLAVIENPHVTTGKELIVFRDSYGSSIAPLFAMGYSKVTLVDLRNLPSWRIGQMIDFTDQDVLFLFSTSVLNHSDTLK